MIKDMGKLLLLSFISIVAYVSVGFEQFVVMAFTLLFFNLFIEDSRKAERQTKKD